MSHPSRPRVRGPARRPRRHLRIERSAPRRSPPARPVIATGHRDRPSPRPGTRPTGSSAPQPSIPAVACRGLHRPGPITVSRSWPTRRPSAATSSGSRPGRAATSARGSTPSRAAAATTSTAINRPGVIYRVDPATGQASVFFDLNTVISQLEPGTMPPTRSWPRPAWSTGTTSRSTPRATSTAGPRCSSARPTPPTRTRTPSTGSAPTGRSSAPSSSSARDAAEPHRHPHARPRPAGRAADFLRGLLPATAPGPRRVASSSTPRVLGRGTRSPRDPAAGGVTPGLTSGASVGPTALGNSTTVARIFSAFTDFGTSPRAAGRAVPASAASRARQLPCFIARRDDRRRRSPPDRRLVRDHPVPAVPGRRLRPVRLLLLRPARRPHAGRARPHPPLRGQPVRRRPGHRPGPRRSRRSTRPTDPPTPRSRSRGRAVAVTRRARAAVRTSPNGNTTGGSTWAAGSSGSPAGAVGHRLRRELQHLGARARRASSTRA